MIRRAFQHRSGRVVAVSRAALALFFTIAVWIEPTEPSAFAETTRMLLIGYGVFALALLRLIWSDWWVETRLAAPAHIVDLVVLTILISLTTGYASPFFAVYLFMVMSASIRWGPRLAIATALIGLIFYFAAGIAAANSMSAGGLDIQRFILRATNLIVLALMIIWFGINKLGTRPPPTLRPVTDEREAAKPPVERSMRLVARVLAARRIVFAWSDSEEPWLQIATLENGRFSEERLGPEAYPNLVAPEIGGQPFLFDIPTGRILARNGFRRNRDRHPEPVDRDFAARFRIPSGLVIPLDAGAHQGHIFATGIPGLCSDDLLIATRLSEDVSLAFERVALFAATQEAAESHARLLLARDLHDSLVQFQAGMALKLQGIRIAAGKGDVAHDIEELQQQLTHEQRDLRKLIAALREPPQARHNVDLAQRIRTLCRRLERQWGTACGAATEPAAILVRPEFQHDIDQLLREAVANAVRHGGANHIAIRASLDDDLLCLDVEDDGEGFPVQGQFSDDELWERGLGPRSLQERVRGLGGRMTLSTSGDGSHLAIALPSGGGMR